MREWMQNYRVPYTIYTRPDRTQTEKIQQCVRDYLDVYLELFTAAEPIQDSTYRERVAKARETYRTDLVSKDRSQKMLGKIIGKKRAGRIFNEVLI